MQSHVLITQWELPLIYELNVDRIRQVMFTYSVDENYQYSSLISKMNPYCSTSRGIVKKNILSNKCIE